jgi:hypothetical protein
VFPLDLSIEGPDPGALLRAVSGWPPFQGSPARIAVRRVELPVGPGWIDRALAGVDDEIFVRWDEWGEHSISYKGSWRMLIAAAPDWTVNPLAEIRQLGLLPFELAAFGTLHRDAWEELGWEGRSFGYLHRDLGWGCAFKDAGHRRLVSRRWLEHGPWRVIRGPGDVTLVQLHDLAADPATALAQAAAGHQKLGIGPESGYLYPEHEFEHEVSGLYEAAHRRLKIVVSGRDVSPAEMLDACVVRASPPRDPGKPIERVAFVFIDEDAARRHLDELWLRELECWLVGRDGEVRLDESHRPAIKKPDWVRELGDYA